LRAGIIEDWNVGDNFLHMEWVEHREWVYEKYFTLDDADAQRYELCFEGLDFSGYVFLNGKELGYFEGMHLPWTFDATNAILQGQNHLRVVFLQPPEVEGQVGYTSKVKILKSRYNYGWDWMPRMVNIGIFGDVTLKIERGAVMSEVYTSTYPTDEKYESTGIIRTSCMVERFDDRPLTYTSTVYDMAGNIVANAAMPITQRWMEITVQVDDIKTWNVSGFGEQALYRVATRICDGDTILDEKVEQIGFRTLTYTRPSGASEDSFPYIPVVNGTPIPVRGINWVPLSPFYGTVTEENYRKQLTTLRDMNITLIRVWGGALLESETFYDICDELGILVWQEFPQSSSGIENAACADPDFIEDLLKVAKVDILRRRTRACLAFWCCGNELYYNDYRPQGLEHPTLLALQQAVKEWDGPRLFLPASPSGPVPGSMDYIGTGKLWDTHGPWNYAAGPYHYYRECNRNDSLLHSEVGAPAASRMEILQQYLGEAKLWPPTKENRYWLTRGAWWLHMDQMREWFGEFDGEQRDINAYVRAFRWVQAEALRYVTSAIRYAADKKAGIIIWMGNEPFPNAANTSLLEFDGCPKPAYYEMKKMFAPTVLGLRHDSIVAKDGIVEVTPFLRADARVLPLNADDVTLTVYDMCGKVLQEHALSVVTDEHDWEAVKLTVEQPILVRLSSNALDVSTEYVFVPENDHPFSALLELPAASVDVSCCDGKVYLTNVSDTVALYCDVICKCEQGSVITAAQGNVCVLPHETRCIDAPNVASANVTVLNM
jgi:beta-mannosidase